MAIPSYMGERRYTYHVSPVRPASTGDYIVATPEGDTEQEIYDLFLEAEAHLQNEEYGLALAAFEELQLFILHEVHPTMPVDPYAVQDKLVLVDPDLLEPLAEHAATMLQALPPVTYSFPRSMVASESKLPLELQRRLEPATDRGLLVTSYHPGVLTAVGSAAEAAVAGRYDQALELYERALATVPADDSLIRGTLLHDMALLADKADEHVRAADLGTQSLRLMDKSGDIDAQVRVLDTMVGVYGRAGEKDLARQTAELAGKLRSTHNVGPIVAPRPLPFPLAGGIGGLEAKAGAARPVGADDSVLLAGEYVAAAEVTKTFVVQNVQARIELDLAAGTTQPLLDAIATTKDLSLVMAFAATATQMVAYSPHMYFFVVPMSIGDCLLGLGSLEEAEATYASTLAYPFINLEYEAVRLWTRLADVYLAMGDAAYRAARDDATAFDVARVHYERIVRSDGTLDLASPLYADASLADIRGRVQAVLAAEQPETVGENPEIVTRVLGAKVKLDQIRAGLNFFGFGPDYLAPLGFEYLQTTARYFAQSAAGIEQRYILFKSTAENEELRREQLDQQVEVARESVVLEQRGLDEAQASLGVAEASLEYAKLQLEAAIEARDEFGFVDWERLYLQQLEEFLEELPEGGMTKEEQAQLRPPTAPSLSQQQEADRLARAVEAARAAIEIAEAQIAQAEARVAVVQQRVAIAGLQQAYAEENRDFLDMREFTSGLWFELAAQARALARRYLDLAVEIAFLMERAYNAETERGLQVVRYDYGDPGVGDLLGADRLLIDVDSFTADYVVTVRSKKLPVKKAISIAGAYPMAFQQLRTRGRCLFGTEFADFDRAHPGMHLCKVRNVELVLVGITSATAVGGSLRNVGVSRFRRADGSIVSRTYPGDVMPISQYEVRNDALLFRFNPNELRAFELNGIDALWQLELPQGANGFELSDLLDAQLVIYYDGFFDPGLETAVRAALPASGGATRPISMALELPDELFFLKSNGNAEIDFSAAMFPSSETRRERTSVVLKLTGEPATIGNLTLRLNSREHGSALTLTTDATGLVDEALDPLSGEPVIDHWTLAITAEDNPRLVRDGELDLSGLRDVLVFLEYQFRYR